MGNKMPFCAICFLAVIAAVSFGVVYLILHHHKPCKNGECILKISHGFLRGRERSTVMNDKTFYSFQGVPYAMPPLGDQRFKDPEPVEAWHGVHDSRKEASVCMQNVHGKTIGSEDCLYLNVYTTQFPDHDIELHPVLVWFHGGGFTTGSGSESEYGPDILVEHNVVLVTVNYRLGAFGFLCLENTDVPGNAGLKDQVMALKWIRDDIHNFGGDPNNVMIFGSDAGAASVHYHTLSHLSSGLYHSAVMQSGTALNPVTLQEDPIERAFRLGRSLKTNTTDSQQLVDHLRRVPPSDIIHSQNSVLTQRELKQCLAYPFVPCVEILHSADSFLREHPERLMDSGRFSHVPMVIGSNTADGLVVLSTNFISNFKENFDRLVPDDLNLEPNSPQFSKVATKIKDFYFGNKSLSINNLEEYVDVCGDLLFMVGIDKTINYNLNYSTAPLYTYKFAYEGKYGFNKLQLKNRWPNRELPSGTTHGDEIGYIFYTQQAESVIEKETELSVSEKLVTLWTNFARHHDPNGENNKILWNETTEEHPTYLEMDSSFKLISSTLFPPQKSQFWNGIYSGSN